MRDSTGTIVGFAVEKSVETFVLSLVGGERAMRCKCISRGGSGDNVLTMVISLRKAKSRSRTTT